MIRSLTTRELRVIAAVLDCLTKARTTNARMGIPTTPDVFTARFPTGFQAVVRWTPGLQSADHTRQRVLERCARHRDGYLLDLATTPDPDNAVALQDPQGAKRSHGRPSVVADTDQVVRASLARQSEQRQRLGLAD